MRISRIRKRDGREVPYDRAKIESAVARAEAAAGDPRAGFAGEVAEVVELLLERRFVDPSLSVPGIEDIQDLVERALVEMGAAAVAKSYMLYREKRAQVRAALVVRSDIKSPRSPSIEARDGVLKWSKGRIVAALMSEADLARDRAEEVASRVEARVFASGMRTISTALVRELVDNELVDLGLERALRRHRPIGLPRHDLRRALLEPSPQGRVDEVVAGEILARYALEEILPSTVAERVRSGDLDFEDLAHPHLPLSIAVPCDLLAPDGLEARDSSGFGATALLPEIGRLVGQISRSLVLEDAEPWLAALERGPQRAAGALAAWLAALGAIARASGRSVEIALRSPSPSVLDALIEALVSLEGAATPAALPRVFMDAAGLGKGALSEVGPGVERLLRSGLLVPTWSAESERFAGPGVVRSEGERGALACGAAAILNLPRLARHAGAWREDALFEAAAELIERALEGLASLRDLQRNIADRRDLQGPGGLRSRAAFALSPVGLCEALAILGDGELREEQAGRLLGFLVEAADRMGRRRGLVVRVTPTYGERAAQRFARLDAEQFRVRQPWLFADTGRGERSRELRHSIGFETRIESTLCALIGAVPTGSLHPPSVLSEFAATSQVGEELSLLSAWERLERRRGRTRGGARALYALPPLFPSPEGALSATAAESGDANPGLFANQLLELQADT